MSCEPIDSKSEGCVPRPGHLSERAPSPRESLFEHILAEAFVPPVNHAPDIGFDLLDPPRIHFSGERIRNDCFNAEEVISKMQKMIVHTGRSGPNIEIHIWDKFIWARGVSALVRDASTEAAFTVDAVAA